MGNESVVDLANLEHDIPSSSKKVIINPVSDENPKVFEDTSFVAGDSPALLDCNAVLSRNATEFSIQNDGNGDFTVATSNDGVSFGGEKTVKNGEVYEKDNLSIDTIRITHVTNSAYRVTVI